jgi:hypothetical protein
VPQFDVTALDGRDDAAAAIDATRGFVRDDGHPGRNLVAGVSAHIQRIA